jgi:hypothetical protein
MQNNIHRWHFGHAKEERRRIAKVQGLVGSKRGEINQSN